MRTSSSSARKFTVDAAVRVGAGECCALFGASGARRKSTILGCIAGVETPDSRALIV